MPTFHAVGLDREDRRVEREIEAATAEEATRQLAAEWRQVTSLTGPAGGAPWRRGVRAARAADLSFVATHLASVVRSGLPVPAAVAQLARELGRGRLAAGLAAVAADLEAGMPLPAAFAARGGLFPPLLSAALVAGERSGDLAGALGHLAEHYSLRQEMRNRWVEALIYPTFLLLVGALGLLFMGLVAHQFEEVYTSMGRSLPYLTELVLKTGRALVPLATVLVIALAAFVTVVRALLATAPGRALIDRLLLSLPVIGRILQADIVARFCHTLGLLLGSAVPLPEALRVAGPALDNAVFARAVARLEQHVVGGGSVSQYVEMEALFPSTVAWLIACGESRGDLPGALLDAGAFYAREARHRFGFLRDAVGPILVVVAALGVFGVFILGLFLPLIDLIRAMS